MKEESVNYSVFTVKNENGESVECEVLFTFFSEETKKDYIIYTDHTLDSSGALKIYANIYDKSGSSKDLMPIETEEEWNTIESILDKLKENQGE